MKIIEGKKLFHNDMPLALSIGKFDGVHLGHRKILSALAARESEGLTPAVLTFDPSPEAWFTGQERVLTTREEKRYLLAQAGVGLLIELPFDRETADTDPAAFAENVLARQLSVRFIAAGPDLSFGAGGRGSFELLESMAGSLAFETQRVVADEQVLHPLWRPPHFLPIDIDVGHGRRAAYFDAAADWLRGGNMYGVATWHHVHLTFHACGAVRGELCLYHIDTGAQLSRPLAAAHQLSVDPYLSVVVHAERHLGYVRLQSDDHLDGAVRIVDENLSGFG